MEAARWQEKWPGFEGKGCVVKDSSQQVAILRRLLVVAEAHEKLVVHIEGVKESRLEGVRSLRRPMPRSLRPPVTTAAMRPYDDELTFFCVLPGPPGRAEQCFGHDHPLAALHLLQDRVSKVDLILEALNLRSETMLLGLVRTSLSERRFDHGLTSLKERRARVAALEQLLVTLRMWNSSATRLLDTEVSLWRKRASCTYSEG